MTVREHFSILWLRFRLWWTRPTKRQMVRECKAALVNHLREKEWSMGNGQCPECCGVPPSWLGHPLHLGPETIGHQKTCGLAAGLVSLGEKVIFAGSFKTTKRYRLCTTPDGYLDTEEDHDA